jgi:Protein of unknown function (DUF4242)
MGRANGAAAEMTYLAECFWPGVSEEQLVLAGVKARQAGLELSAEGAAVRYLGAILVPADEVVFCLFRSASADFVRAANEQAAIPFERIVESLHRSADTATAWIGSGTTTKDQPPMFPARGRSPR